MLGKYKHYSSQLKLLIFMIFLASYAACTVTPTESDSNDSGIEINEPSVEVTATETKELPESNEPRLENLPVAPEEHNVEFRASAPEQYVVAPGDTLWDLSNRYLVQAWFWPEIWYLNPQIEDPHLIYPGDEISIFYVGGKPYLTVNGGPRTTAAGSQRLSPSVRSETIDEDPYAIPIQAIQQFIIRPRVVSIEELENAPYIVGSQEERLAYGSGDRVYVRGLDTEAPAGSYTVFRPGDPLYDVETEELLGYEAILVGDGKIVRIDDPATFDLGQTKREALRGDRLLPVNFSDQDTEFIPHAPDANLKGHVISVFDAISQVGAGQVITLNLGVEDGIEKGHILSVSEAGRVIDDPFEKPGSYKTVQLPEEAAGFAMVFRTFENVSYALIMKTEKPIQVGDAVATP